MTMIAQISEATISDAVDHRLQIYAERASGAYSSNTERAIRSDTALFASWCRKRGLECLPATPLTVSTFVVEQFATKAPASVRRYVASIAHLHRAAGLADPTGSEAVKLAIRRMHRAKGRRQRQVQGLTFDLRNRLLDCAPRTLIGRRSKALLAVAYDTLLRRSELVGLRIDDLSVEPDGTGTVLIRRTKTDQEGEGAVAFLAADTMALLRDWIEAAELTDGPLFRSMRKGGHIAGLLDGGDVARIFKRMAKAAHLPSELVAEISGHSTRVGGAQDMAAHGIELGGIMQAGRWKTPTMVARYTERLVARRGGAAKLATLQNRV